MAHPVVSALRVLLGLATLGVLAYAYRVGGSPSLVDYFGYFTNLTSLLTAVLLISAGAVGLRGRATPRALMLCRAVCASCMIVVGVIYNTLVPGTGSAPPWVSVSLHAALPILVVLDWAVAGDRLPLPWRSLWLVLPYPLLWLAVVLRRGATDGWVPYGFLLPERGIASLLLHIAGLLATLLAAGALVWGLSRFAPSRFWSRRFARPDREASAGGEASAGSR